MCRGSLQDCDSWELDSTAWSAFWFVLNKSWILAIKCFFKVLAVAKPNRACTFLLFLGLQFSRDDTTAKRFDSVFASLALKGSESVQTKIQLTTAHMWRGQA